MGDIHYEVAPLNTIPAKDRSEQAAAVQLLCGKGGMDITQLLLSENPYPTIPLMWGRLYNEGKIVGGILYYDYGSSIQRVFVCVEQGKGYLSVINKGFEDHILGSREDRPIHAALTANVRVDTDGDRKVALAHMLQGYKIIDNDPKRKLVHETSGILMRRIIGSPLPTEEEKKEIIAFHNAAKIERDQLAAAKGQRVQRQNSARRRVGSHRRTRRRKRFSTRRNKKHNG
jgi:hypothetical protein